MDIPHFIQKPLSATVMETACLLAKGMSYEEVAGMRHLSLETIKDHARILRFALHTNKTKKATNRLIILRHIPVEVLDDDFPAHWQQYIKP